MTDQPALDLAPADDPTPLRWGLNDVLWGDDDTVTVLLSGPDGEPYWLELDPERAAVLREAISAAEDEARHVYDDIGQKAAAGARLVVDRLRRMADETQPTTETPTEDPARIDRIRPEFTEHASTESIDAQLQRARAQERRWHIRTEWLISLRADRVAQKERGEWPATGARQDGAQQEANHD